MRMNRQIWSSLIAVCMLLSVIGGCGDDSDSGGASGSGGSSAGASGNASGTGGVGAAAVSCSTYCALAVGKMCTGSLAIYPDTAACMTGCAMITTPGSVTDTAGNTLGCRIYHLTVANSSATNAMMHCPHGKVMSDVCK